MIDLLQLLEISAWLLDTRNWPFLKNVIIVSLFVAGTWILVAQPEPATVPCDAMYAYVPGKAFGNHVKKPWVLFADSTIVDTDPNRGTYPPFACGELDRKVSSFDSQIALLYNMAELKVLFDSLRVPFWIDRDNLASISQPDESGDPAARFHHLDSTLELGMFAHDLPTLLWGFLHNSAQTATSFVGTNGSVLPYTYTGTHPALPVAAHNYTGRTTFVVVNEGASAGREFCGVALKVMDWVKGAEIVITAYQLGDDNETVTAPVRPTGRGKTGFVPGLTTPVSKRTILPLKKMRMYNVDYACPASPHEYLDELAGGSWLVRARASRVKWLFVCAVFLTLVCWVFRRS
eukprot:Rhum_TRINITY_DN5743_c0_g1::Rhum_TRINITY_DN5743_c0_g1_i1::g.18103::m.18103